MFFLSIRAYGLRTILSLAGVFSICLLLVIAALPVSATAGINEQLNYQARLLQSTGAIVPDGTYNMEFKVYQDGNGIIGGGDETLKWTETRTGGDKVTVTNGYFSVQLGSVTAFASNIDWNQNTLWLSLNIGGTGTPTWDGEMSPFRRLSSNAYALNAKKVGGLDISQLIQLGPSAVQVDSGNLSSIFVNKTGSGNVLELQRSGTGILTLSNIGAVTSQNSTDSTNAFRVLTTTADGSHSVFNVDTTNERVGIGGTASVSKLEVIDGDVAVYNNGNNTKLILGDSTSGGQNGYLQWDSTNDYFRIESVGTNGLKIKDNFMALGNIFPDSPLKIGNGSTLLLGVSTTGETNVRTSTNSTAGFVVEKTNASDVFTVDTSGGIISLGQASTNTGQLNFYNSGGANAVGIKAGSSTAAYVLTLPTVAPNTSQCLKSGSSTATDMVFGSCGAGGASTLQDSYNTGSAGNQVVTLNSTQDSLVVTNPTSSGTDSAFTLQVNQNNTTANVAVLDLVQASNAANGVNLTANAITSGKALSVASSTSALTGSLMEIALSGSNASNTGSLLKLSNTGTSSASTGLFIDHRATGAGNYALRIDDTSSDDTPFVVDGDGRVGIGTTTIAGTTERLLQVGSPTNRGNAAVYGELVSKGMRDLTTLTNIRDIFVYDTTADSDGGRWIDWATTDKMSWFNETLDDGPSDICDIATDDRCYSQSFPRRAVLVVTTDALYIFDGQTNTMWMKFSQNAAGWALGVDTNNNPSSITALNGVIYVGTNGTAPGGMYAIDFTSDRMWNYDDTDRSGADVGIGSRNTAVTYGSDNTTAFDLGANTGWKTVNDVSSVVVNMSSTPIAATTGPGNGSAFVGLATDSGVVLINLSQQRLFQYSRITDNNYSAVAVTKNAKLYALESDRDELDAWTNVDSDQASQLNTAADKAWDETTTPALTKTTPNVIVGAPDALEVVERGSLADSGITAGASQDLIYVGTDQGLTELHDHATLGQGWVKYYNTTRQTGIMPATIRRTHMMDEASGNITNQSNKTSVMTPKGTPTYGASGVRGKGLSFNGTSQYLCSDANADATCDNDTTDNMNTGSWTISVWFKHPTAAPVTTPDVLFARCYNTTPAAAAGCVAASMTTTGSMAVNVDFDATWTIGVTGTTVFHNSTQTYNDNQWHHLMVTRAATTGNVNTMIDGKPIGQTAGLNTTLDASQIWGIGTDCSGGAACSTGGNFWEGQIDDFIYNANGSTGATDVLSTTVMRRIYNEGRPLVNKKVVTVTDATTVSTTTIGDSGETWIPQEFAGLVVTLTGGTGSGQTRHIVSNTATTITVSPAFTSTPDTTTDFEVDPEALYGASDSVKAIGITAETPMGEARQMCVGTNSGTDTGGVTCYNHNAGPNVVADIYHADSEQFDDSNVEWTGTDYDDVQSIDMSSRALVMGSEAHFWTETEDVKLGQGLDYLANKLFDIRAEILNDGISTVGSLGMEVGLTGGADLAERYTSSDSLVAGEIVSLVPNNVGAVKRSTEAYQKDVLGIVATQPGLVLGPEDDQSYPIALVGRVPLKVTAEKGVIKSGDRIASSSLAGYGMKAVQAGRTLGTALDDMITVPCPDGTADVVCGEVTVFVNLVDYTGQSVELAVADAEAEGLLPSEGILDSLNGLADSGNLNDEQRVAQQTKLTQADKILRYLSGKRAAGSGNSEVLTDKVSTGELSTASLFAQDMFASTLTVGKLKANQIDGLEVGGLAKFRGNAFFYGLVTFVEKTVFKNDISIEGHILTEGASPDINVEVAAGQAASDGDISIPTATATLEGNDSAGEFTVTTGANPAAGQALKILFSKPYDKSPRVQLTPANDKAGQLKYYVESTKEGFAITFSEPPSAGAVVKFNYLVVQ